MLTRFTLALVSLATALLLAVPIPAQADESGHITPMSSRTLDKVIADTATGEPQPTRCYVGNRSVSAPNWAFIQDSLKTGCARIEGYWIVHRTAKGWVDIDLHPVVIACSVLRWKLERNGAPSGFFKDLRAVGMCERG